MPTAGEDPDPASPEFGNHRGYEADLITAAASRFWSPPR